MALTFIYSDPMGVDQPSVSSNIGTNTVRFGTLSVTQTADVGTAGVSQLEVDDPNAGFNFQGWRNFRLYETSAPSNNTVVWTGAIGDRTVYRADSMRTGSARRWRLDLVDWNWNLQARVIKDSDGKRPAETAADRLRWVMASRYNLHDYGHVSYPTTAMDACDYRGQRHGDVLNDLALATGYQYWAEFNEAHQNTELFFIDPNDTAVYTSSVKISNSLSDVDSSTVFAPYEDAVLVRSPQRIAYGVYLPYANGSVYVDSPVIADQFAHIDQTAPMANVKTAATARVRAQKFLSDHATEEDAITCSVMVPAAQVNDIRAGHAVQVKFTHLPGYTTYTWMRVRQRTVVQDPTAADGRYRIVLEMSDMGASAASLSWAWIYNAIGTNPYTRSLTWSPTAGNTLLVMFGMRNGFSSSSVRANNASGAAFSAVQTYGNPGSFNDGIGAWSLTASGAETAVYIDAPTGSGANSPMGAVVEVPGMSVVGSALSTSGSGTSMSGPSVTPTAGRPAYVIGIFTQSGDVTTSHTAGSGWTLLDSAYAEGVGDFHPHTVIVYKAVESASGSYSPAVTSSSANAWQAITVALS